MADKKVIDTCKSTARRGSGVTVDLSVLQMVLLGFPCHSLASKLFPNFSHSHAPQKIKHSSTLTKLYESILPLKHKFLLTSFTLCERSTGSVGQKVAVSGEVYTLLHQT